MAVVDILLPSPLQGSGGHRTVVINAEAVARAGHLVRLHVKSRRRQLDCVGKTRRWFPVRRCAVLPGWPTRLADSDAVLATSWNSATHLADIETTGKRLYFVQDYEPMFYPAGDLAVAAARTYELGFTTVVIGSWLQHKLWMEHGAATATVPFTADRQVYYPTSASRARLVAAVLQPDKPRRCPDLACESLRLVLREGINVVTFGSRRAPSLGKGHTHLGLVSQQRLGHLYRTAAAGLSLSASNPSRIPFEMMAAGLPTVELHLPNTIFDFPERGCILARPDAASIATALGVAVESPAIGVEAASWMRSRPSISESSAFCRFLEVALEGRAMSAPVVAPSYTSPPLIGGV